MPKKKEKETVEELVIPTELLEKDIAESIRAGAEPDPFDDWEYSATKKTLH